MAKKAHDPKGAPAAAPLSSSLSGFSLSGKGTDSKSIDNKVIEKRVDAAHVSASALPSEALSPAVSKPRVGLDLIDPEEAARLLAKPAKLSAKAEKAAAAPPLPAASQSPAVALHVQAEQLAEHLRARQKELDHREAALNARTAQLEREERAAELWLSERKADLEAQAQEPPETVLIQEQALARKAEDLVRRQRDLDEAEARLDAERSENKRMHDMLVADRRLADEELRSERQRLHAEHLRLTAEVEQQRRSVHERAEQVDQAATALDKLRDELSGMHRETLEIRLATEELWSKLSGSAPSDALNRSLSRIRTRLADHYRLANAELLEKKEELELLRQQLSDQYERLLKQKRHFDEWAVECRDEAEQQAVRLDARNRELDQREAEMHELARRWQAERMELQHEVRRLRVRMSSQATNDLSV